MNAFMPGITSCYTVRDNADVKTNSFVASQIEKTMEALKYFDVDISEVRSILETIVRLHALNFDGDLSPTARNTLDKVNVALGLEEYEEVFLPFDDHSRVVSAAPHVVSTSCGEKPRTCHSMSTFCTQVVEQGFSTS